MKYKHLTEEERYHIAAYKKAGYKQKDMAKELGVSPATISRELKRNSSLIRKSYSAKSANNVAVAKRRYASMKSNKKMDDELKAKIIAYIKDDYSPEQISGTLQAREKFSISHVTIYGLIKEDKLQGGKLHEHLRFHHTGHRRAKYGSRSTSGIKDRVSISKRPDIVNESMRIGDIEIDTIVGANQKGAITTAVDRGSKLVRISKPTSKKASEVASETIRILQDFKDRIHTITSDNGLEFANHKEISKVLECDYYFCHPYSSCERGLNEYTNGLIRQYIPKGTSFENITKKEIKKIEDKLNNRPRKSLGWRTPNEVFFGLEMAA
ncbi:MAG: IS30 family transposase [Epsilonproteobacteria bacterium]|nr:IS30 family transposase [Campylobacterota bacterium]